ncbi:MULTISPECIES: hypothetical protein [unclassified Coleofasciculus]|nr:MULTISPECIES: hypothetical protein [unclassified Coleofasciculus]
MYSLYKRDRDRQLTLGFARPVFPGRLDRRSLNLPNFSNAC